MSTATLEGKKVEINFASHQLILQYVDSLGVANNFGISAAIVPYSPHEATRTRRTIRIGPDFSAELTIQFPLR